MGKYLQYINLIKTGTSIYKELLQLSKNICNFFNGQRFEQTLYERSYMSG